MALDHPQHPGDPIVRRQPAQDSVHHGQLRAHLGRDGGGGELLERGVVVNLENDVDGFVPLSQLAIDDLENPRQSFDMEQEVPLKVIEFDEEQKKVVLSVIEYLRDKDQQEVDDYVAAHPIREVVEEPEEEEEADHDEEMESWG